MRKNLQDARKSAGLTQDEVAEKIIRHDGAAVSERKLATKNPRAVEVRGEIKEGRI